LLLASALASPWLAAPPLVVAQQPATDPAAQQPAPVERPEQQANGPLAEITDHVRGSDEGIQLRHAAITLPLAALLGAALAYRPVRRGTPPRTPAVIQTQIILALVGAIVMLVVGASLARAFAIVGAASLVRYRAKIDDPKDAGVMLSALTIGLAVGVGLYLIAVVSTAFILLVLGILESLEPEVRKVFALTVKAKDATALRPGIEALLKRNGLGYELRSSSRDDVAYEVAMPLHKKTDRLSNAILALDEKSDAEVEWEEKKKKELKTA
jgi:uncharacterized membrane protein YhiD involved in acid resistance